MDHKQLLLQILGASGIIGLVTGAIWSRLLGKIKAIKSENEAMKQENDAVRYGVQALLRHELYELYNKWASDKKYATIAVKEDFSNMYERYHLLGANGVMDGIRDEFMNLPTHSKGDTDDN